MEIRIMDGKRELVYQVNSRHQDGTQIDFGSLDHIKQVNDAYIRGLESIGYKHELVQERSQGVVW